MTRAHELVNAERATDEGRAQLHSKVAEEAGGAVIRVPVGQGLAGTAAASGELLNVKEAYSHPHVSQTTSHHITQHHATSCHVILAPQRAVSGLHP